MKENLKLRKELEEMRKENEFLKKAAAFFTKEIDFSTKTKSRWDLYGFSDGGDRILLWYNSVSLIRSITVLHPGRNGWLDFVGKCYNFA